jgi:hypothetical protein
MRALTIAGVAVSCAMSVPQSSATSAKVSDDHDQQQMTCIAEWCLCSDVDTHYSQRVASEQPVAMDQPRKRSVAGQCRDVHNLSSSQSCARVSTMLTRLLQLDRDLSFGWVVWREGTARSLDHNHITSLLHGMPCPLKHRVQTSAALCEPTSK